MKKLFLFTAFLALYGTSAEAIRVDNRTGNNSEVVVEYHNPFNRFTTRIVPSNPRNIYIPELTAPKILTIFALMSRYQQGPVEVPCKINLPQGISSEDINKKTLYLCQPNPRKEVFTCSEQPCTY